MKKLVKKGSGIVLILIAICWFLIHSLTIYPSPQTTLIASATKVGAVVLSQDDKNAITCYQPSLTTKDITQNHLRLLVWNLHKGLDKGWQQALTDYSEFADFVLLQEATSEQQLQTLLPNLSNQLFATPFAYRGVHSGVALLTKFTPQSYCSASVVEPWIRFPKASISTLYPLDNGQSLLVISAHLINFELIPDAYQQQLQQLSQQVKWHTGPVILAGDFNAWSEERTKLLRDMAQQLGLVEVKFEPDYRVRFNQHPLDYVFVRGMNVIQAKTEENKASDHNPLLLELSFQ